MKSYLWLILVAFIFGACSVEDPPPTVPQCLEGTHLDVTINLCVADWPDPPCGQGTHEENNVCVADMTSPRCGHGTEEINHTCVPKKDTCGEGTEWQDGKCVPTNPTIEVCDGKDNNGDDQVDESDPNLGTLCVKAGWGELTPQWGILLCGWNGTGQKELMCSGPSIKLPETCNGVDDNANGEVDEGCNPQPTKPKKTKKKKKEKKEKKDKGCKKQPKKNK